MILDLLYKVGRLQYPMNQLVYVDIPCQFAKLPSKFLKVKILILTWALTLFDKL